MDMEKLKKAIIYVDRMANGYNPVKNIPFEENEILNDINVVRCMYFIKNILEKVYTNSGIIFQQKPSKPFDYNLLHNFTYRTDLTLTNLFRQLNEVTINTDMMPLKFKPAIIWLEENGYLRKENSKLDESRKDTVVTEKGELIGIYNQTRVGTKGSYLAVMYNKTAQEFIVQNLKEIMESQS